MTEGTGSLRFSALIAPLARPPALLVMSFMVVSGAIVANALLLQPRHHPAPLVVTRGVARSADQPKTQRSDDLVLAVQSLLRKLGYYGGPLDGVAGPQTQAGIRAFEAAAGRPETGEASLALLAALKVAKAGDANALAGIAAGQEDTGTADAQEQAPAPDSRVAAVQHALAISAYGPLQADGVFGPQTREAILRFQRDHNLAPTGEISDGLLVELRAVGALEEQ